MMGTNFFDQFDGQGQSQPKPSSPLDNALAAEKVPAPVANIARSIYQQESGSGRNTATSNAGAVGGMQIIPSTFKSVADPDWDINNPEHNARAGVRYISQLYDKAGGDPKLTAAGYYGGPGGLEKARQGVAVSDPRNPNAPNTLQYGQQVAARLPKQQSGNFFDQFDAPAKASPAQQPTGQPANAPTLTKTDKFMHGLMDPIAGASQLITKLVPDSVNQAMNNLGSWVANKTGQKFSGDINDAIKQREVDYNQARAASGETGIDGYRIAGNALSPANLIPMARASQAVSLGGRVLAGMANGAATGAMAPVASDDYWSEKVKQAGAGAAVGGAVPAIASGIARVVSPNASVNPNVKLLRSEGVNPTIGQTLGGWVNSTEEKLQSVPILGDMIARARGQARQEFNTAAINRATSPVGVQAQGAGHDAVKQAGNALGDAYDNALSQVQHVPFDQQFHGQLSQLQGMAQNMVPSMAGKFNKTLSDVVLGRVGPQDSMLGSTYKNVDSELGRIASRYGKSQMASEQEYGDAVSQLQSLLSQQMRRANPQVAQQLEAADKGWANLVRVEGAAKAAHNNEGVFTPGQLNAAIRDADDSVRGRAVSRGDALMQDLGSAGQQVLGNKVPNSGTADRMWAGAGALAAGLLHPAIPAGLVAGGALYTRPVQSLLTGAASARPAIAQPMGDAIRRISPAAVPLLAPAAASASTNKKEGYANGGVIDDDAMDSQPPVADPQNLAVPQQPALAGPFDSGPVASMMAGTGIDADSPVHGLMADSAFAGSGNKKAFRSFKNGGLIGASSMASPIRALAFGRADRKR